MSIRYAGDVYRKITSGEKIDHDELLTRMRRNGITTVEFDSAFLIKEPFIKYSTIDVYDDTLANELLERAFPIDYGDNRISAAAAGDSHRVAVSGSLLNVYCAGTNHPVTIISKTDDIILPPGIALSTCALVIENLELFLRIDETLEFVNRHCESDIDVSRMDIIYGAGNAITKSSNKALLSHYNDVYCLFDVDQGGLKMYQSLFKLISADANVCFLIPDSIEQRLVENGEMITQKERTAIAKMTGLSSSASKAQHAIYQTHRKLEQETYLLDVIHD